MTPSWRATRPSWLIFPLRGEDSVSAKVPHDVVLKLNADLDTVLKLPELAPRWTELGITPLGGSPDAAVKRNSSETETWTKVIRAAGIHAD